MSALSPLLADVRPLEAHLPFGVRIGGLTLEILKDATIRDEIDRLFIQHGMIVFENVENSDAMQLALSSCFGPLKEHPVKGVTRVDGDRMPGVVEISARLDNSGIVEINGKQLTHWLPWHFDHAYNDELNRAGVLRAMQIVEEGGITGFMDGIALYNMLPKDLLARIEGKEILYSLRTKYSDLKYAVPENYREIKPKPFSQEFNDQAENMARAIHPAVWTRATGEKCLHVAPYMCEGILNEETPEGDALLDEVCKAIVACEPTCSYHHKWKPSDMLIWDNTRMLHCVSGSNPTDVRVMYRTTIKGDYGLGRWDIRTKAGNLLETA
ncbi:MAG: TauD/TfdA family dioxygenase [Sphingomonadales bacterium]|nr:TauD/TfdA family dioxygenase [Sphingomonadales bacterium]